MKDIRRTDINRYREHVYKRVSMLRSLEILRKESMPHLTLGKYEYNLMEQERLVINRRVEDGMADMEGNPLGSPYLKMEVLL